MTNLSHLLRSLVITSLLSFLTPVLFIGAVAGLLLGVGQIPALAIVGQGGWSQISQFLSTFGSGSALRGLITIGTVCSLVGILFDTYTFYRYQNFRH